MPSFKKPWFFLALAIALCAVANAKTTTLRSEDKNLRGAMRRMGCTNPDPRWEIETMRRSGILGGDEVDELRPGAIINVPDECITGGAPPKSGVRAWKNIVEDHLLKQQFRKLKNRVVALTVENQELRNSITRMQAIISSLRAELTEGKKNSTPPRAHGWLIGWLAFALLALVFIGREMLSSKDDKVPLSANLDSTSTSVPASLPKQVGVITYKPLCYSVPFYSHVVDFYDASVYRTACSMCHEFLQPSEEAMEDHLHKKHSELRLVELSPEELKNLLGIREDEVLV